MKRVAGALLLLLGLVGLLAAGAGIVGCWVGYERVSTALERVAGRIDGLFGRSTHLLDQGQTALVRVQADLDAHDAAEKAARAEPTKDSLLRRQATRKATQELDPQLNDTRRTLTQVTEAAVLVNSLLEEAKELDVGTAPLDPAKAEEMSTRLTTLIEKADSIQAQLAKLGPDDDATEEMQAESTQAREVIKRLIELVNEARTRLTEGRQKVAAAHARTQFWLFWGTVAATVILVWVALGQWCLMVQGWRWLCGPRPTALPEPTPGA